MKARKAKGKSSQYKGVSLEKKTGKWRAEITKDRVKYHLGMFVTEQVAAEEYNKAALKYHGKFTRLNVIYKDK